MSKMNFHTNLSVYLFTAAGICLCLIVEEYLNIDMNTTFRVFLFILSVILISLSVYVDEKYLKEQKLKGDSN